MNPFLERAQTLKEEIIQNRRHIHSLGGTGFDIPDTVDFVMEKLREMGLAPQEICKGGIVCNIGTGKGKTILLRADMDALPIEEQTGLPFACANGTMHACGHDMHPAMLLAAAKMLKEREDELCGTVKLMFQPAEEILEGAKAMLKAGLLENPKVDAAIAMHVGVGRHEDCDSHYISYVSGASGSSADEIKVTISKRACGGGNPLDAAAQIVLAIQEIPGYEVKMDEDFVMVTNTVASAGGCDNEPPEEVVFTGVMICRNFEVQHQGKSRLEAIVAQMSECLLVDGKVEYTRGVDPMVTSKELGDQIYPALVEIVGADMVEEKAISFLTFGADDFAMVCSQVPGMYLSIGAGSPEEGYTVMGHRDKVLFNEDVLPTGAAIYANAAYTWLKANADEQ